MQTEKVKSNIGLALPASVVFVGDSDEVPSSLFNSLGSMTLHVRGTVEGGD
jgi:hypothetical protein